MEDGETEEGMGGGREEWRAGARQRGGEGWREGEKEREKKKVKQSGQIRFGVEGSEQGDYSN